MYLFAILYFLIWVRLRVAVCFSEVSTKNKEYFFGIEMTSYLFVLDFINLNCINIPSKSHRICMKTNFYIKDNLRQDRIVKYIIENYL
jgi:hypothetical protein